MERSKAQGPQHGAALTTSSLKHVGLDVHQATTVAAVRDAGGRVIARTILPTDRVDPSDLGELAGVDGIGLGPGLAAGGFVVTLPACTLMNRWSPPIERADRFRYATGIVTSYHEAGHSRSDVQMVGVACQRF